MSGTWGRGRSRSPPQPSGGVSLWSSQHRVGALWTQHWAGLADTAKEVGRAGFRWAGPGAAARGGRTGREGLVSGGSLGAGRKGPSELDLSEPSPPSGAPARAGDLLPHPAPAYPLDPFFSSSHIASPLPLEVGPASNPVPQTGSPLGIW